MNAPLETRLHRAIGKLLSLVLANLAVWLGSTHASGAISPAQPDSLGTLVDVGTFSVRVPDVDDWDVRIDKQKCLVEFSRTKQKVLSLFVPAGGITSMNVFRNRPSDTTPGVWVMTEQAMADHFRQGELLSVMTTAPRGAKLDSSRVDSAVIDGRTYYRLAYSVSTAKFGVKGILHLYFPPEFARTKEFFGFLVTDASVTSWFTVEDVDRIRPLMRSLQTVGSASTLPGVEGDLLCACSSGDSARVRYLVEGGANPNALPGDGRGPLGLACLYGHQSVVRYLVERGAKVNPAAAEIYSPLSSAILGREVRIAELLLAKGARANVLADSQWTALIRAITMHLDTNFVARLLACGADVNLAGTRSPLMQASSEGLAPVVLQLLDHGANPDWQDAYGWTALFAALERNCQEVAGILLSRGANPNATSKTGESPLIYAARSRDTASIARLIQLGARVNVANKWGFSPLAVAADNGCTECVRLLLSQGATIDRKSEDGRTPLYLAVQGRYVDCMRLLLDNGADISASTTLGWTPLMAAAKRRDSLSVALLISRGAKLDMENNEGDTALEIADDYDFESIVEMLEKAAKHD